MFQHPKSAAGLSPKVANYVGAEVPKGKKMAAASGFAPLGSADMVSVLYVLAHDQDEEIRDTATKTLTGLPERILVGGIDQVSDDHVLDGLSRLLAKSAAAAEHLALNRGIALESLKFLAAAVSDDRVLEIIASNEQALLREPDIIEALYENKQTRQATTDRLIELAARNDLDLKGITCISELKAALAGELIPEATDELMPDDLLFKDNLELDDDELLDEKELAEALEARDRGEDDEDEERASKVETLEQSLAKMTVSAKIRTAMLGSARQRSILIRDSNKLVAVAVVKSPSITESEVVQFAKYRSLPEEAVRYMATKKDWTRHYQVKLSLVQNPRTPLEFSLRFLTHLRPADARALERDKNVPQAISRAAIRLRNQRQN